jgi:type IX secretion system PorP/SprF family membrane protein
MKQILLIINVICCWHFANAQDPHFSQYYFAPLRLNPAQAGLFEGSFRGGVNYRSQWASVLENNPYRTIAANYDHKFQVSRHDHMGLSVDLLQDQAGPANFNQFEGHIGASYAKKVSGTGQRNRYRRGRNDQYIAAGFQVGAGQLSLNLDNLWFSKQYDPNRVDIDRNASTGEPYNGAINSNLYLDVNAGLMWYAIFDDNKSIYAGGSLFHANAPFIRFNQSTRGDILRWRWVGQVGAEMPISNALSILPAFTVQNQGASQQFLTGANLRYNAKDWREVALRIGTWARIANQLDKGKHLDAIVLTSILEMEKLNIGLSYDINVSNLRNVTNYRGAFEIAVQYIQPPARRKMNVNCPRF